VSPRRRGSVHLASAVAESAGMPGRRVIAVIGAGASGTLTAVHLLRRGGSSVQVVLIDPHEPGLGVAYSTIDPQHLLNVRASCMSAFGSEPRHLLDWCSARGIDAGALHGMLHRVRTQSGPVSHVERALPALAEAGARRGDDHGFNHVEGPLNSLNVFPSWASRASSGAGVQNAASAPGLAAMRRSERATVINPTLSP